VGLIVFVLADNATVSASVLIAGMLVFSGSAATPSAHSAAPRHDAVDISRHRQSWSAGFCSMSRSADRDVSAGACCSVSC
jgi:hypothetical protein